MNDIETKWSLDDLMDAHEFLNLYERLQRRAQAEMRAKAERKP